MTAALLLGVRLSQLPFNRASLADNEAAVANFIHILTRGCNTWTRANEMFASAPDAGSALAFVKNELSFTLNFSNPRDFSYITDRRLARDAISFGAGTHADFFALAAEPAHGHLAESEDMLIALLEEARWRDGAEASALTEQARAARARTPFGRKRADRRVAREIVLSRAVERRADLIRKIQTGGRDLVQEGALEALDDWGTV